MSMTRSRLRWAAVALAATLLATLAAPAQADREPAELGDGITVMSRNLYFGADLTPVVTASNPAEFQSALIAAFLQAQGSNFPLRMEAVADEIADTGAALVGMQEVATWTLDGVVVADFAQLIIDDLAERGLGYEAVVVARGFQFAAPIDGIGLAGLTISDVILARTDLPGKVLKLKHPRSGTYATAAVLSTPFGDLPFPRQWASIDVKLREGTFRFVTTHLESLDIGPYAGIRQAQATELLTHPTSPLNTTGKPVVLVGDLNSEVGDVGDAADLILRSGFTDAWAAEGEGPGFTFGHDANLADPSAGLTDSRIDFVMVRGGMEVEDVMVVDTQLDPTPSLRPLWPSDHGGVVAALELD